ncbi:hypothetical protein [Paenibacillus naphthalenovorans]|uniref:hypothetical protein n=1 Tax=Paenibacillus naphthalenovorans TaxID=162209 RepID=UPI003D2CE66C
MNSFLVSSLLLDRQPPFKHQYPANDITVLIAAHNEEKGIRDTLRQISCQDYEGSIHVLLVELGYQMLTSPIAVWGYLQEAFQLKRVWK